MILFDSLILWNDMLSLNKFKEDKMNKIALISISLILLVIGIGCAAAADLNVNDASLGGSLGGGGNEKLFAPACVDESVSTEPVAVSDDGARPLNNVVNDSVDDGAREAVASRGPNIFASSDLSGPNIFRSSLESRGPNIFASSSLSGPNIFRSSLESRGPNIFASSSLSGPNIFRSSLESRGPNIFAPAALTLGSSGLGGGGNQNFF